jgi:hypothetical protein
VGKQINFYLSDHDQAQLADMLNKRGYVAAATIPAKQAQLMVTSIPLHPPQLPSEHRVILYRPEASNAIRLIPRGDSGLFFSNVFDDPIVDFDRCIMRNDRIMRGRVYAITRYVDDNGVSVIKSDEFRAFVNRLFKDVRKFMKTYRDGVYFGEDALELEKHGMKLVDL